jgi:hypothetical protein
LAQHGKGGFSRSIDDLYQVALLRDGDIADTRMPCQGPAYIQHSQTAEKTIDLESGAVKQACLIDCYVGDHMHVRSYPHIA